MVFNLQALTLMEREWQEKELLLPRRSDDDNYTSTNTGMKRGLVELERDHREIEEVWQWAVVVRRQWQHLGRRRGGGFGVGGWR